MQEQTTNTPFNNLRLLYSNPYEEVRRICESVTGNRNRLDVPKRLRMEAASALGHRTTLIPIPGPDGQDTAAYELCLAILDNRGWRDVRILQCLQRVPEGGFRCTIPDDEKTHCLTEACNPVLTDAILDTGWTALAAQQAIGIPCGLITIGSTGRSPLPLPKMYYEIVRIANQGETMKEYAALEPLSEQEGPEGIIEYLSNWDCGQENINTARYTYNGFRCTPKDNMEPSDRILLKQGEYTLCQALTPYYQAYYLAKELER